MSKTTKISLILFFIGLLAFILRIYNIFSVPPSPSLDEASIGYNAFSILKTGSDEYGTKFPLLLRAYDDWRPALYVYLVIPFVELFGLNLLAVRLPSVLLSVGVVIATYYLFKKICSYTGTLSENDSSFIALLSSFLLAISPWHIYVSRLGHEVNAGLSFLIFGLLCFFEEKMLLSILFFTLSFASYQSEKIVVPIIIITICGLFTKKIIRAKKEVGMGIIVASIIIFPFLKETFSGNALIRFNATNIFNASQDRFKQEAVLLEHDYKTHNLLGQIFHNRRSVAVKIFLEGYIAHFNPEWLFTNSSSDFHKVPNIGLLYLWELPFIILGIILFLFLKFPVSIKVLILVWFFSSPLPAAITTQAPHALRSYTFLPLWQVFSALGFYYLYRKVDISFFRKASLLLYGVIIIFSLIFFYKQYFFVFPKTQSSSFQYALSSAIPFVLANQKHYTNVVFSNKDALYQSYMFFLFFSKYDPLLYQKEGGTRSGGYDKIHIFGKYEFRPINSIEKNKDTLYIGNLAELRSFRVIETFDDLDGSEKIVAARPL